MGGANSGEQVPEELDYSIEVEPDLCPICGWERTSDGECSGQALYRKGKILVNPHAQ